MKLNGNIKGSITEKNKLKANKASAKLFLKPKS